MAEVVSEAVTQVSSVEGHLTITSKGNDIARDVTLLPFLRQHFASHNIPYACIIICLSPTDDDIKNQMNTKRHQSVTVMICRLSR